MLSTVTQSYHSKSLKMQSLATLAIATFIIPAAAETIVRNAYFGDLHVHTKYSLDAYGFGARTGPDEAYEFAKGASIKHPSGQTIRMRGAPLDFLAVTDHAEYLGSSIALDDPDYPFSAEYDEDSNGLTMDAYSYFNRALKSGELDANFAPEALRREGWQRIVEAAERHNAPGQFTTFVGYEYTSAPAGTLHTILSIQKTFGHG